MKRLFLLLLACCMLIIACSHDEENAGREAGSVSLERNVFQEVKEQTEKNPKDADARMHLAHLYEGSRMYPEEIATLKKVIELAPDTGYAYLQLGTAYNRIGNYAEAVKSFAKAKKYFPRNPQLYNNIAVSQGLLGNTAEEIRELEQAIALRSHYATARYNLGKVYLNQGKRDAAMQQYRSLLEFDTGVAEQLKKEIDAAKKK
jgi:tetratricopeptide (TPR) repeat protein